MLRCLSILGRLVELFIIELFSVRELMVKESFNCMLGRQNVARGEEV
jgi:hypothetical protein